MKHIRISQQLLLATSLSLVSAPVLFASDQSTDEKETTPTVVASQASADELGGVVTNEAKTTTSGGFFSFLGWGSAPLPTPTTDDVSVINTTASPVVTDLSTTPTEEEKKDIPTLNPTASSSPSEGSFFTYFTPSYWLGSQKPSSSSSQETTESDLQETSASPLTASSSDIQDEEAPLWSPEGGAVTVPTAVLSTDATQTVTSAPEDMLSSTMDFAQKLVKAKFSYPHSFPQSARLGYAPFLDKTGVSLYEGALYTLEFAGRIVTVPASVLANQDSQQTSSLNLVRITDPETNVLYESEKAPSIANWGFLPESHFMLQQFATLGTVKMTSIRGNPVGLLFVDDKGFLIQENDVVNIKIANNKPQGVEGPQVVAFLQSANPSKAPKITQIKRAGKIVYSAQ